MARTNEQHVADIQLVGEQIYGSRFGLPLAARLGVAQSQVSRFISGKRNVPPELDDKLLEILDEEIGLQELKLELMRVVRSEFGERISKSPHTVQLAEQTLVYKMLEEILEQDDT